MINIGGNIGEMSVGNISIGSAYVGSQLVWQKSSPALPYDAEVEWLESDGNQWIDTGITGYSTLKFNIHIIASSALQGSIFGSRVSSTKDKLAIFCNDTNGIRWDWGNSAVYVNSGNTLLDTGREIVMRNNPIPRTMTYDETYTVSATNRTFNNNYNIHLFGLNNAGTHSACRSGLKILSFKLTESSTTLLELIPVRKNGVGYMYDKVSGTLFGNAGTGDFTLGSDVT